MDPNLAFGWGIHIIDGPNHSVLCLLLACGVAASFVVSGMVVGLAKTQGARLRDWKFSSYHPRLHHGCYVFSTSGSVKGITPGL